MEFCSVGFFVVWMKVCRAVKMKFFMAKNAKYKIFLAKLPL